MNHKKISGGSPDGFGPSKFSGDGFLGNDLRPVEQIIDEDIRKMREMGISKEKLIAALENAYTEIRNALGAEVKVGAGATGKFYEAKGKIPSPFPDDGWYEKGEAGIKSEAMGDTMVLTALSIHLVRKYGFFQGKGSRYRIEPETAARLMGMAL